jgi:hypothetical protein
MTDALVPCPACCRHLRASEPACPFCRAPRPLAAPSTVTTGNGASRLAGALLAATVSLTGLADAQPLHPRLGMEHAPAQGYGAPPFRGPDLEGPGGPIERRPPPPVGRPSDVEPGTPISRARVTVSVSPAERPRRAAPRHPAGACGAVGDLPRRRPGPPARPLLRPAARHPRRRWARRRGGRLQRARRSDARRPMPRHAAARGAAPARHPDARRRDDDVQRPRRAARGDSAGQHRSDGKVWWGLSRGLSPHGL